MHHSLFYLGIGRVKQIHIQLFSGNQFTYTNDCCLHNSHPSSQASATHTHTHILHTWFCTFIITKGSNARIVCCVCVCWWLYIALFTVEYTSIYTFIWCAYCLFGKALVSIILIFHISFNVFSHKYCLCLLFYCLMMGYAFFTSMSFHLLGAVLFVCYVSMRCLLIHSQNVWKSIFFLPRQIKFSFQQDRNGWDTSWCCSILRWNLCWLCLGYQILW